MKKMRIKAVDLKFNGKSYRIEGEIMYEKDTFWSRLKKKFKKEPKRFSF